MSRTEDIDRWATAFIARYDALKARYQSALGHTPPPDLYDAHAAELKAMEVALNKHLAMYARLRSPQFDAYLLGGYSLMIDMESRK